MPMKTIFAIATMRVEPWSSDDSIIGTIFDSVGYLSLAQAIDNASTSILHDLDLLRVIVHALWSAC